jgi:CheY-like chemotaxis protein
VPGHPAEPARILVVEDDQCIRETLCAILADEGFQVESASNGREALDHLLCAANVPPHLLIVDVMMPVLNGWELCAEMARRPQLAPLPVLIVSANAAVHEAPRPLRSLWILEKPIRLEALLGHIQTALETTLQRN